jgi:hypothetical protein
MWLQKINRKQSTHPATRRRSRLRSVADTVSSGRFSTTARLMRLGVLVDGKI